MVDLRCPDCGGEADLVEEKVRWHIHRCRRCHRQHYTCAWPTSRGSSHLCGGLLPKPRPLACPTCGSIISMDAAPKRPAPVPIPNRYGLNLWGCPR